MGKYGMTVDNLRSVEVVTATGEVLTASEREHADLFWGLRGGGGNFGIATSFEFQLHPVGEVVSGIIAHPFDSARDVLRFYRGRVHGFVAGRADGLLRAAACAGWLRHAYRGADGLSLWLSR